MWISTSKKLKFILTNLPLDLELVPNSHFWLKKIGQNLRKKNQKIIQNKYYVLFICRAILEYKLHFKYTRFREGIYKPNNPTEHLSNIEAQISIEFESVEKK